MVSSKIIIVDDEKKIVKLIESLIDWDNLPIKLVGTANDGISALELIKELKPDIVILDMKMPGFNGIELICKAKEIYDDLNFIIISGYRRFEYAHNAIKYGVEDYLLKPVQADELNKALDKILNKVINKKTTKPTNKEDNFLRDLFLQGSDFKINIDDLKKEYNIGLNRELFEMFLLQNDLNTTSLNRNETVMLQTKAENIIRKKLDNTNLDFFIHHDNRKVFILLNYNQDFIDNIDILLIDIIEELHSIKDIFRNLHTTISRSGSFSNFSEILTKKNDVKLLISERLIMGCDKVIISNRSAQNLNIKDLGLSYIKTDIIKYCERLDVVNIKRTIDNVLIDLLATKDITGQFILDIVEDILADVSFILKIRADQPKELESQLTEFKQIINNQSSLSTIFDILNNKVCELIIGLKNSKENMEARPIVEVKKYINENFFMSLTLNEVSEFIGMNPSYFSTLFKKETGIGFLEYLTGVRIEEAKELLADPKRLISDTASEVGYKDTKHFTKQFKKIVGLSPIEYRKIYY